MFNFYKLKDFFRSHYKPSLSIHFSTLSSISGSCKVTAGHLLTGNGPSFDGIGAVASQATLFLSLSKWKSLATSNLQNNCHRSLLLQCSSSKSASSSVMNNHLRFLADYNDHISSRILAICSL